MVSEHFKKKLEEAIDDTYDVNYTPGGAKSSFDSSQAVNNIVHI